LSPGFSVGKFAVAVLGRSVTLSLGSRPSCSRQAMQCPPGVPGGSPAPQRGPLCDSDIRYLFLKQMAWRVTKYSPGGTPGTVSARIRDLATCRGGARHSRVSWQSPRTNAGFRHSILPGS
jgi:hypothetical protein